MIVELLILGKEGLGSSGNRCSLAKHNSLEGFTGDASVRLKL